MTRGSTIHRVRTTALSGEQPIRLTVDDAGGVRMVRIDVASGTVVVCRDGQDMMSGRWLEPGDSHTVDFNAVVYGDGSFCATQEVPHV